MESLVKLRPATNRKTPCSWVQVFGVSILFSYETAMAFSSPAKGSFRRKDWISRTTLKHLRETGADRYTELDDESFERELNEAVMYRVISDRDLMQTITGIVVANKLAPETV